MYNLSGDGKRAVLLLSIASSIGMVQMPRWTTAAVRLETIHLPPGFSIAVYAQVPGARSMTLAPDGTLFVGSQSAEVHAVLDRDRDGRADEVVTVADDLQIANGVAFLDDALFVADMNRVLRYDDILEFVNQPAAARTTKPTPSTVLSGLPSESYHGWRYLAAGPDGLLYLAVGAPCNTCERSEPYASLLRLKPDGTGLETIARGVRNSVGMDWDPRTSELWFTDNGRDFLGDDTPADELNRLTALGQHFGLPYCHGGTVADPEFGRRRPCAQFTAPAQRLGPHVAAIGMKFYTGEMFPAGYRHQIFVAEHGSWNRTTPIGYRLSLIRLEEGQPVSYQAFAEGWLQGFLAWGRPVDLLVMPDGSLLVSDDTAGAVYRITYTSP